MLRHPNNNQQTTSDLRFGYFTLQASDFSAANTSSYTAQRTHLTNVTPVSYKSMTTTAMVTHNNIVSNYH